MASFKDSEMSLRMILQKHEEQLIDVNQNICLLCKRKFPNNDQIKRHRSLSQLHAVRLKRLRKRLFSDEQLERLERKEREALYRDRARERRLKYGVSDRLLKIENPYSIGRNKLLASSSKFTPSNELNSSRTAELGLSKDNKGAALLSKMGWKEGTGLGKSNQGMTNIIQLKAQVGTSGLGSKKYKVDPSTSYKEAVKQKMLQRYQEISYEDEEAAK